MVEEEFLETGKVLQELVWERTAKDYAKDSDLQDKAFIIYWDHTW